VLILSRWQPDARSRASDEPVEELHTKQQRAGGPRRLHVRAFMIVPLCIRSGCTCGDD